MSTFPFLAEKDGKKVMIIEHYCDPKYENTFFVYVRNDGSIDEADIKSFKALTITVSPGE